MKKNNHPKFTFALLILLCAIPVFSFAQNKNIDYFRDKYPGIGEVILNQNETFTIAVVNNKLDISSTTYEESYIIDEDVIKRTSLGAVPFSTFQQVKDIEANTLVPNGTNKFKKIGISTFKTVPGNRSKSTFHDDFKYKQFDYPNLSIGAKKTLKYTTVFPEPRLLRSGFFIDRYPIERKEFVVITDKNVELGYSVFNNDKNKIKFSKEDKNGKIIYRWEAEDIPKYSFEEKMPSSLYFTPMIEIFVKNYTDNTGQKKAILSSLNDLHSLYESYIKGLGDNPSAELVELAKSLKSKHTEEIDQVKEIYYWVKNNIKYIAFEDGYGGFIPRNANDVYSKRYGDCKDMSSIIYTMLKAAGIQNAYITWIGSREKPFRYDQLHTQLVDDHMIVTYRTNGKNYFLDGTSRNTPFGYPTYFIQGKQALLHIAPGKYDLVEVPIIDASQSKRTDNVELSIENTTLHGKASSYFTGYQRDYLLENIQDLSGFQKTEILKKNLELGNNKFILGENSIQNQLDKDKPLIIDYTFDLDSYAIKVGNDIYINLALNKMQDVLKTLNASRQYDYEINYANEYSALITLKAPIGYKVESIPKDGNFNSDLFSYSVNYQNKGNEIQMKLNVSINYLLLKTKDIAKWNSFVTDINEVMNEAVEITKE